MDEQQTFIANETPEVAKTKEKYEYKETELAKYLHAGNIIFNESGDVFIHARATKNKDVFLKILIELHSRYIGD